MNRTISAPSLRTESRTTINRAIGGFSPSWTFLLRFFMFPDRDFECFFIHKTVAEIIAAASNRIVPLNISCPIPFRPLEIESVKKANIDERAIPIPKPPKIYLNLPLISLVAALRMPSIKAISTVSRKMTIAICSIVLTYV